MLFSLFCSLKGAKQSVLENEVLPVIGLKTSVKYLSKIRRMALLQERKQEIISDNQVHETDTGSVDVQIAMLTDRINTLSQHLQKNKKDYSSRRGLMKMIGQRKRLLAYLTKQDPERYKALIQKLGIRR